MVELIFSFESTMSLLFIQTLGKFDTSVLFKNGCFSVDVEHEVRCLRKWIREMEARLQPLDFRVGAGWSLQELEEKAQQHMVSILCILTHVI